MCSNYRTAPRRKRKRGDNLVAGTGIRGRRERLNNAHMIMVPVTVSNGSECNSDIEEDNVDACDEVRED